LNKNDNKIIVTTLILGTFSIIIILIGFRLHHLKLINGTQLSYAGTIIGGFITVIGVAWTLNRQEKEHINSLATQKQLADEQLAESRRQFDEEIRLKQEELESNKKQYELSLSLQNKPIITLVEVSQTTTSYNPMGSADNHHKLYFRLTNNGSSPAFNVHAYQFKVYSQYTGYTVSGKAGTVGFANSVMHQNDYWEIMIDLEEVDYNLLCNDNRSLHNLSYQFTCVFDDCFGYRNSCECKYITTLASGNILLSENGYIENKCNFNILLDYDIFKTISLAKFTSVLPF